MKALYAVRDTLADAIISNIVIFPSDAPAVRWFTDAANDRASQLSRHLSDHELVRLGAFDEATGQVFDLVREQGSNEDIRVLSFPVVVITGTQLAQAQEAARG